MIMPTQMVTRESPALLVGHFPFGLKHPLQTNQFFSMVQSWYWNLVQGFLNGSQAVVVDLGGVTVSGGSGLADGNWHHLAVSVPESGNSGGVKLYVDGSATSGTGTTTINTSSANDLKIGTDGTTYFNGQLDDIRLYEAELNSTMVAKVYGGGTGDFNRLKLLAAGSFTVTASQAGDSTYGLHLMSPKP